MDQPFGSPALWRDDDLIEIVAPVHVRGRLGLVDGDVVAFTLRI